MKASSDLFDLINLLSQSEKRYVKLKSSFHLGNKQYIELMSILERQKSYDAKSLEEEWEGIENGKSLAITKNYLYEFILTALEQFNASSKGNIAVHTLLKKVDILFDKALYKQCAKLLRKARRLIVQSQSSRLLLEILVWELRIILTPKYDGELKKTIDDIFTEENRILSDLSKINRARHFRFGIEAGLSPSNSDYKKWLALFPDEIPAMVTCEFNRAKATYLHKSQRSTEALPI